MTRQELGITEAGARHVRSLAAYYSALDRGWHGTRARPTPQELDWLEAEMDEATRAADEEYWEDRRLRGLDCSMRRPR